MAPAHRRRARRLAGPPGRAPPGPPPLTSLGQRAEFAAYRFGALVGRVFPWPAAATIARTSQPLLARVYRSRQDMTAMARRHLRQVYGPGMSDADLEREVVRLMDSYARYYMELFLLPSMSPERLDATLRWEGVEHVYEARDKGNGVIVAMPHTGHWDMGGASLARRVPCTAVVERLDPPELFEWFTTVRARLGFETVPLGPQAGPALMRALRANRVIGLMCDRDVGGTGVEVEFFGQRTRLPGGPATLALRSGAPILPTAAYFDNGHHVVVVRPPVPAERTGRLREDVVRVTQALTYELEDLIRRAPHQWHNFQPTWPSDLQ